MKKLFFIKKKGFTLIELLAVIVILAIILLIAMPIVLNVIGESRKGAFESSARGLIKTTENECLSKIMTSDVIETIYSFNNGVQTVEPSGEALLKFSGSSPKEGYILVDVDCKVEFKLSDGTWYVEKDIDNKEIVIEEYEDQELTPGEAVAELPDTDDITYINDPEEANYPENATPCLIEGNEFTHITDKRETDPADHKNYAVTQIGTQCWLAENLAYTGNGCLTNTWNDAYSTDPWDACRENEGTGWDQDEVLYQWGAAMDGSTSSGSQGLCPVGWYIPSNAEWTTLTDYLSTNSSYWCVENPTLIAKSLALATNWTSHATECRVGNDQSSNNTTGFNGAPVGNRNIFGVLSGVGVVGDWWTSSLDDEESWCYSEGYECSWSRYLRYSNHDRVSNFEQEQSNAFSVRCVLGL